MILPYQNFIYPNHFIKIYFHNHAYIFLHLIFKNNLIISHFISEIDFSFT